MFRVAVALYLMLASAAGPWLCCCTGARLLGFDSLVHDKQGARSPCCCGHRGEKNQGRQSSDAQGPKKSCPCQEDQLVTPAVSDDGNDRSLKAPFSVDLQAPVLSSPSLHLDAASVVPRHSAAFPFNGRDTLCALQVLRC